MISGMNKVPYSREKLRLNIEISHQISAISLHEDNKTTRCHLNLTRATLDIAYLQRLHATLQFRSNKKWRSNLLYENAVISQHLFTVACYFTIILPCSNLSFAWMQLFVLPKLFCVKTHETIWFRHFGGWLTGVHQIIDLLFGKRQYLLNQSIFQGLELCENINLSK